MIRGSKHPNPSLKRVVHTDIHNRFDIEVIDSKTRRVKQLARGYNTICNQLWTKLLVSDTSNGNYNTGYGMGGYFSYIHYGTGTGTPSSSDTSLFSYLGGASAATDATSFDPVEGVYFVRRKIQLSETTAVGQTLTEVGIASGSSSTSLCTHAMLKDMNGNPISITKSDTDIINIYATVFVHFNPQGYDNGHIRFVEPKNIAGLLGALAGISTNVWGFNNYPGRNAVYVATNQKQSTGVVADASNKTFTFTMNRLGVSDVNIGGIKTISFGARYDSDTSTSMSLSDPPQIVVYVGGSWFPGTEIKGEAVGTGDGSTVDYSLDFPNATNATIYVDGVASTEVTVDPGPLSSDISREMVFLDVRATPDNHIPFSFSGSHPGPLIYNPLHELGLSGLRLYSSGDTLYASNDLSSWIEVGTQSGSTAIAIPEEYAHYKYWKCTNRFYRYDANLGAYKKVPTGKNVHFTSPPAEGAVITADYFTECIAKDSNHVFDFYIILQLGEYTEAQ